MNENDIACSTADAAVLDEPAGTGQGGMSSWERMSRAVHFEGPNRVPVRPDVVLGAWKNLGKPLEEYLNSLPLDQPAFRCGKAGARKVGQWTDAWNCVWKNKREGEYGTCVGHPLEDWRTFSRHTFPKIDRKGGLQPDGKTKPAYYRIRSGATEYGILWYRMQFLRGFENVMMDLIESPERIGLLRDAVLESRLYYLDQILKTDLDAIHFGDCWGMQHSLMIQPEAWRRFFKPAYATLFERVHATGKTVVFQSDGYTLDIVEDLVAIGADVLRLSVGMMDLDTLAGKVSGRACLWSDPCRQHVLPHGTPREVRAHIRRILDTFHTREGGLIGGLYISDDVPLKNVQAALDTYLEYGT